MSVTIRQATKTDAKRIAELEMKLVRQHQQYDPTRFSLIVSKDQMASFFGNQTKAEDAAVLVAELEGKIVGIAYVAYEAKNYADLLENAAWLHDIYIDETARGQNAGKLLIEKSIEAAKQLGADKLMLSVAAKNTFAREFFDRRGFRETMVEMMVDLTDGK